MTDSPKQSFTAFLQTLLDTAPSDEGLPNEEVPGITIDQRVDLWLVAVHGRAGDFSDEERAEARGRVLDAMAYDMARQIEERKKNKKLQG